MNRSKGIDVIRLHCKEHLTMVSEIPALIKMLENIEPGKANFLSCYFDISDFDDDFFIASIPCIRYYRHHLKNQELYDFEEALSKVIDFMENDVLTEAKGIALFVRPVSGGAFLLAIQLAQPLANKILLSNRPSLFDARGEAYLPLLESA